MCEINLKSRKARDKYERWARDRGVLNPRPDLHDRPVPRTSDMDALVSATKDAES